MRNPQFVIQYTYRYYIQSHISLIYLQQFTFIIYSILNIDFNHNLTKQKQIKLNAFYIALGHY